MESWIESLSQHESRDPIYVAMGSMTTDFSLGIVEFIHNPIVWESGREGSRARDDPRLTGRTCSISAPSLVP